MKMFSWMSPLRDPEPASAGGGGIPGLPPPPSPEGADIDVKKLASTVEQMGRAIGTISERLRTIPNAPPSLAAPAPPVPAAGEVEKEFWKNPISTVEAITKKAITEANAQTQNQPNPAFDTLVEVARRQARDRDPEIFDMLIAEISTKINGMPAQFHQNSQVWNNAFNMAVGENMDRVIEKRRARQTPPPTAASGPGPAAPSARASAAPPAEKLSDDEREFCKKFGLSDDAYRRGKVRRDEQGSGRPGEKSSWDGVLTFDSDITRAKRLAAKREKEKEKKNAA